MKTELKINKKAFEKLKLSAIEKISSDCITNISFYLGQTAEDILDDMYTFQIVGYVYSRTIDERKLTYYCERPTFLDWLFRRKKKIEFDFKASDLLINPPDEDTLRIYDVKSI